MGARGASVLESGACGRSRSAAIDHECEPSAQSAMVYGLGCTVWLQMSSSLEIAGVVIAAVTFTVAVYAALEARWARQSSQRGEHVSDHRWQASTRPRPRVGFADPAQVMTAAPGDWISVKVSNPGGSVPSGLVVARIREKLYIGGIILPAQSGDVVISLGRIAVECPTKFWTGNMLSEIVAVYAEDLEGRMWECLNGAVATKAMPSPGTDEFFSWLEDIRAQARSQRSNEPRPGRLRQLLRGVLRRGEGRTTQ